MDEAVPTKPCRYYVVTEQEYGPEKATWCIFTLSRDPGCSGWDTDSGYPRYGIGLAEAMWLADLANRDLEMRGLLAEPQKHDSDDLRDGVYWNAYSGGVDETDFNVEE